MNNGTITPTRPSMGAWLFYGLGAENANLPGYVVLCPGRPVRFAELWTSAFLPGELPGDLHQPYQSRSAAHDSLPARAACHSPRSGASCN